MTVNVKEREGVRAAGRAVVGVVDSVETLEGAGFLVRRPFPRRGFSHFDPFLLLDEMGPMDLAPGEAQGAPDHPHRGFETVSYILSGELEHKDSTGHSGKLGAGVMNTEAEIHQAIEDYRSGRMGEINF